MRTLASVGVVMLCSVAFPDDTSAQEQSCGDRKVIIERLKKEYSETPRVVGLLNEGALISVTVAPNGTFTVLIIKPDGTACVVGAGQNWTENAPTPNGPEA